MTKARLYAATITPLAGNGTCDAAALAAHCRNLIARGCDGIALFGTTGEGPSFSVEERQATLEAVIGAGIAPETVIVGIGCAALPDASALANHAAALGCRAALFTPPFYFKDVNDDGLYDAFDQLIAATADRRIPVIAYHIPPVTGIALSPALIRRLRDGFGDRIAAVKDSSSDWTYTRSLLEACPDLPVLVGEETHFSRAMELGAAGSISGLANLIPGPLRSLLDSPTPARQDIVDRIARQFETRPFVPAIKAALAKDGIAATVRPPLSPLEEPQVRDLHQNLAGLLQDAATSDNSVS